MPGEEVSTYCILDKVMEGVANRSLSSLAYLELRCILAKLVYAYDLELVDKDLNWAEKSSAWGLWWKPELNLRVIKRPGLEWTADDLPL